ncbi:RNA-binding 47 [Gossypium arboreum]|uniref:RNA-binding 47 n=1 Tax=Gossypium arboreum TaxID=29729 RepID=A0A0B0P4D2_GOSAR|nr:RNA-binding 47 [Gossypium arboreum]KHG19742.1 RNA-binding 47 [Gossypium arboreum]
MQIVPILLIEGARPCLEKFDTVCVSPFGVQSSAFIAKFIEDGRTEEMSPGDVEAEHEGLSCEADPLVYSRIF